MVCTARCKRLFQQRRASACCRTLRKKGLDESDQAITAGFCCGRGPARRTGLVGAGLPLCSMGPISVPAAVALLSGIWISRVPRSGAPFLAVGAHPRQQGQAPELLCLLLLEAAGWCRARHPSGIRDSLLAACPEWAIQAQRRADLPEACARCHSCAKYPRQSPNSAAAAARRLWSWLGRCICWAACSLRRNSAHGELEG